MRNKDPVASDNWETFLALANRQRAIKELPKMIALAEVNVLTIDELLARLGQVLDDPQGKLVVDRLTRLDLSSNQQEALRTILENLVMRAEQLGPKDRVRLERVLPRVLCLIPPPIVGDLVRRCLSHPRLLPRKAGYKYLRTHGVDPSAVAVILEHYRETPNQELLELIAQSEEALTEVNLHSLMYDLRERYWRMRVLRWALISKHPSAEQLAFEFPLEFLWAVGRGSEPLTEMLPLLRRVLAQNSTDIEFVRWCIWAFGKLGARQELAEILELANSLILDARNSNLSHGWWQA